jgi:hypothetical protein
VLPFKADRCNTQEHTAEHLALEVIQRKEGAILLPQADSALLRNDESRKHMEWRLCGNCVSNLSKTSGMHIKSFITIHYIHSSFFPFFCLYISVSLLRSIPALVSSHFEHCSLVVSWTGYGQKTDRMYVMVCRSENRFQTIDLNSYTTHCQFFSAISVWDWKLSRLWGDLTFVATKFDINL